MAWSSQRREQNEDNDLKCPLLSNERCQTLMDYETCRSEAESPGFSEELRFIMLGVDEELMIEACDIIMRGSGDRSNSGLYEYRKGCFYGKKISIVKIPCSWISKLAPYLCCSRDKTIKDQILDCASLVFPGPHAFLLVMNSRYNSGNEKDLLKVLKLFGKEALDYAMILFVGQNNPNQINILKKVSHVYTIENNDQSVQGLFAETSRMTQHRKSKFFIQLSYEKLMEKSFLLWVKEKDVKHKETERKLKKEIADIQQQHEKQLYALKEKFSLVENGQKKKFDALKFFMLDTLMNLKTKDIQQEGEPEAMGAHMSRELEACKESDTFLRNIFSSIVDKMNKKLESSKETETCLREMLSSMLDDQIGLKEDIDRLQREVEQLKGKKQSKPEDETTCTIQRLKKIPKDTDVDGKQGVLEREVMKMEELQMKSSQNDSQVKESNVSETLKPVRRNSLLLVPPEMSEVSEDGGLAQDKL